MKNTKSKIQLFTKLAQDSLSMFEDFNYQGVEASLQNFNFNTLVINESKELKRLISHFGYHFTDWLRTTSKIKKIKRYPEILKEPIRELTRNCQDFLRKEISKFISLNSNINLKESDFEDIIDFFFLAKDKLMVEGKIKDAKLIFEFKNNLYKSLSDFVKNEINKFDNLPLLQTMQDLFTQPVMVEYKPDDKYTVEDVNVERQPFDALVPLSVQKKRLSDKLKKLNEKLKKSPDLSLKEIQDIKRNRNILKSKIEVLKSQIAEKSTQLLDDNSRVGIENIKKVYEQSTPEERDFWGKWYDKAHDIVNSMAKTYDVPLDVMAAIVAVLSPGSKFISNISLANKIMNLKDNEEESLASYPKNIEKALAIKKTHDTSLVTGPKVEVFFESLISPELTRDKLVLDGHAISIWLGEKLSLKNVPSLSDSLREKIVSDCIKAAEELGISQQELQATTWYVWRYMNK